MHKVVINCKHIGTKVVTTEMDLQTFLRESVIGNCVMLSSKKAIPMNDIISIELKELNALDRLIGR